MGDDGRGDLAVNPGAGMARWWYRIPLAVGCLFILTSCALYVALDHAVSAERAVSPGQESLGVAVLGMLYVPPIIGSAAAGLLALLVGMSVLAFQRMRTPD